MSCRCHSGARTRARSAVARGPEPERFLLPSLQIPPEEAIMTGQLQGKVAIVTGGGTGIGEAVCRKFGREGATVVVNGLPGDPIADVVTAILDDGGTAMP